MARSDPAVRLRTPARGRAAPRLPAAGDEPRTRLVVTRGHLAIELDAPASLGPLAVTELGVALPDVEFPVELGGGVAAFKHRRGRLDRLRLELSPSSVSRWGAARLAGLLDPLPPELTVALLVDGWLCGLRGRSAALAFEVVLATVDGELRLVPTAARGLGLGAPPQALAIRALAALAREVGEVVGGAIVVAQPARLVAQALLPLSGMRVPDSGGLAWGAPAYGPAAVGLLADREEVGRPPYTRAVSALELAGLVATAEQALSAGDLDGARREYLAALERAPRHPEIVRRIVELDMAVGRRAEAAAATLNDVTAPIDAGALGGRVLEALGDVDGARVAYRRAAETEPYGPLSALCSYQLASLGPGDALAAGALADAIARAPSWAFLRWRRLEASVALGQIDTIKQDVAELEASCRGASERHAALRRAGELLLQARMLDEAAEVFERALRYTPDSVDAVVGLARCLQTLGQGRRALQLLSRAVALSERARLPHHRARLELARGLAEVADDRPAAIAHVRAVPAWVDETFEARLLEARWRAELGDLAGAHVALGLLADAAEAAAPALLDEPDPDARVTGRYESLAAGFPSRTDARVALAALLEQGAAIEELDRADLRAARRLYATALRLDPRKGSIRGAFRRVSAAVDGSRAAARAVPQAGLAAVAGRLDVVLEDEALAADPADELEVERLTARLRADPDDARVVEGLAAVLERLGRDHELLALLSARIEDGPEHAREALGNRRRTVIERMAQAARAAGRAAEAEALALMLERGRD